MFKPILLIVPAMFAVSACAGIVDFTFSYDVHLYSAYLQNDVIYERFAQSHNADASTFVRGTPFSPYNGGLGFVDGADNYTLAATFFNTGGGVTNWATGTIVGTVSVGTSDACPAGTPVPFAVCYEYLENPALPCSTGMGFYVQSNAIYSIEGKITANQIIFLDAGQTYDFYTWYTLDPIPSGMGSAGILFNFAPIPEPATMLLLGLGGLLIRKKH